MWLYFPCMTDGRVMLCNLFKAVLRYVRGELYKLISFEELCLQLLSPSKRAQLKQQAPLKISRVEAKENIPVNGLPCTRQKDMHSSIREWQRRKGVDISNIKPAVSGSWSMWKECHNFL